MQDGLAMALNMLGRHDEARAAIEAAIRLNGESGDATQGLYNLYNLSQSHSLAGEPAQALPWAGQALVLARRIGFAYFLPHVHVELALIYLGLRQFEEARRELDAARRLALDHQDLAVLAAVHEATARLALDEGDTARARGEIANAARLCLEHDNVMTSAALVLTAARLLGPAVPAEDWLDALRVLAEVQQPVRRLAAAARGQHAPAGIASAPPPSLRELVAQVIVATARA
jgi:tetratricopeptide (TPR) repeat protein